MRIKHILFDFGGVIVPCSRDGAVARFREMGLRDAAEQLDPYTQKGIFGDLEAGRITDEDFRREMSRQVGRELSWNECQHAWLGYFSVIPKENLALLQQLRQAGYHLVLISNTNPFVMGWAMSPDFDGTARGVGTYFDACYLSYQCGMMKPEEELFHLIAEREQLRPEEALLVDDGPSNVQAAAQLGFHTYCPAEGEPWAGALLQRLQDDTL